MKALEGPKTTEKEPTCRPAREERETGFFLSLSLLVLLVVAAAEDLPISRPFAPLPDMLEPITILRLQLLSRSPPPQALSKRNTNIPITILVHKFGKKKAPT